MGQLAAPVVVVPPERKAPAYFLLVSPMMLQVVMCPSTVVESRGVQGQRRRLAGSILNGSEALRPAGFLFATSHRARRRRELTHTQAREAIARLVASPKSATTQGTGDDPLFSIVPRGALQITGT